MRLIDADALKEWLDEYLSVFKKYDKSEVKGFVDHAPTIEPKRGEWIWHEDEDICNCSECEFEIDATGCIDPMEYVGVFRYCPNCGADMREREGE